MVRLTDSPYMTIAVYRGGKTTTKQQHLMCVVIHVISSHCEVYGEKKKVTKWLWQAPELRITISKFQDISLTLLNSETAKTL